MKAVKTGKTLTIAVGPEEVTDAVRGFAWYNILAKKPDMVPNPREYVWGSATFDGTNFIVVFSKETPVPNTNGRDMENTPRSEGQ